ncbi:MAG: family 20 glycosylhydrolase [Alistipes onderdonkii]
MVAYAAERFIEVIPEIEFPGHSDEVFAAYPELCCSGRAYTSGEFCVGNPLSLKFMDEVLTEVLELFPSKYIHIGGDEADRTAWKSCPRCRHLARSWAEWIQVQCYLVEHAEKFLAEHGRTMIGWDEILKNNLRSTSTVISYRGQRGGIEAANRGYDVVMSPGEILYFDWYQADPHTQPRAMGGFSPIRKMYGFHPVPDTPAKAADNESIIRGEFVSPDSVEYIYDGGKEHVIGVQGCTWMTSL